MMQAAARSYRLNQTHDHCKVYYLFAEGTMEQTAVQLMSRKQRAAKLLTGDIGLTGLDALTENEGGFEEALLEAIGRDETLLDPAQLFKAAGAVSEIDAEDAGYWNVEGAETPVDEPLVDEADPLIALALELGGTVTPSDESVPVEISGEVETPARSVDAVTAYLETVHLIADDTAWQRLRAELLMLLDGGTPTQICLWLTEHQVVFPGCEAEVAAKIVALAARNAETESQKPEPPPPVVVPKRQREPERQPHSFPRREAVYEEPLTQQLALF